MESEAAESTVEVSESDKSTSPSSAQIIPPENFALITGGTFEMGSLNTEAWRLEDETLHTVTVSDFYMSIYEVTGSPTGGQSLTAIAKLNPNVLMGEALSIYYSGDGSLPNDIAKWLEANKILE